MGQPGCLSVVLSSVFWGFFCFKFLLASSSSAFDWPFRSVA